MTPTSFVRVGDVLPKPVVADPARPNEGGYATPVEVVGGYPLYRVVKRCVREGHGATFMGTSFYPQYDDDPPQSGWCEACIKASEREREDADRALYEDQRRHAQQDRDRRAEEKVLEKLALQAAMRRLMGGDGGERPRGFTRP